MRTDTQTLASALDVLAREIQSGDGVANAAIAEAAERLRELEAGNARLLLRIDRARAALYKGYVNEASRTLDGLQDEGLNEELSYDETVAAWEGSNG